MNAQFKKGVLEMCVMALLGFRDRYGYELVQEISGLFEISEGSIYPLLRRLLTEGYVSTYLQESGEGPARKYYSLTMQGKNVRDQLIGEWNEFSAAVNGLINEVVNAEK
jgi:PadR family transcriptional regulator, regulatory protein PadR